MQETKSDIQELEIKDPITEKANEYCKELDKKTEPLVNELISVITKSLTGEDCEKLQLIEVITGISKVLNSCVSQMYSTQELYDKAVKESVQVVIKDFFTALGFYDKQISENVKYIGSKKEQYLTRDLFLHAITYTNEIIYKTIYAQASDSLIEKEKLSSNEK